MELIERAERYLRVLSDVESELARRLSEGFGDKFAVEECLLTVQRIKSGLETALEGWRNLQRGDPTGTLYKGDWRRAGIELRGWENMYPRDAYEPAKELGIELPQPGSWQVSPSIVERPKPTQAEYTTDGEEICVDRRWECTTFRQMLSRDRRIPQRILAFQVPGRQGKTRLMRRFEHFCTTDAAEGERLLFAKVDFMDRPLCPHTLAHRLLTTILKNARTAGYELPHELAERMQAMCKEIERSGSTRVAGQAMASEFELASLAEDSVNCLRTMADEWTIVLILDTFESAGAAGDWFLGYFIPELSGVDGLIVTLAGREGLSLLEPRKDEVLFRKTLEPMKHWEDCQRMAQLHYELVINEALAKHVIETYGGDLFQIDLALRVFKDMPEFMPDVDRIPGV